MDLNQYLRYQFKQPYWVLRNEIYKKHVYNKNGIAHFYCFETGELADEVVVPDGCADIIFRCNEDEPDMILAGVGDKALRVIYPSNCYFFGVRLIPGAYYSLGNIALKELKADERIPLYEVFNDPYTIEKILESRDFSEQINLFLGMFNNEYICHKIDYKTNPLFENIIKIVIFSGGRISLNSICKLTNYSERRVRDVFCRYMGISVKSMCEICRFQEVTEYINYYMEDDITLAEIALKFGYYDQAHLTKEFKRYSLYTPKKYINEVRKNNYADKIMYI